MNNRIKTIIRISQLTALFLFMHLKPYAQGTNTTHKRPNIIFIITDDQRWDALNYAGNELIHTPNMDRLAEEGVYFENAFVTTPIVLPAEQAL